MSRIKIAFDVSEGYRRQVKSIAAFKGKTVKKLYLETLAIHYPEVRDATIEELRNKSASR